MATDFTSAEKIGLFQALDVPYSTSYTTLDGMGMIGAETTVGGPSTNQAKTVILAALDTLADNDSAGHDALQALVQRFNTISTKAAAMVSGGAGDVQGVSYDFEVERNLIRERIKIIMPYYKLHEVMARLNATKQSGSAGIVRL